jgi:AcrR family transcriptional regulator
MAWPGHQNCLMGRDLRLIATAAWGTDDVVTIMLPLNPATIPSRVVGRPRRLTLDGLLDAAIEGGLADLNMKELAGRLGVGIATLYRYVENRDTLVRLATGRQAGRRAPPDAGQDWADLARAFADTLFASLGGNAQLVIGFIEAQWGIAVEMEFVDAFLGAMTVRGFDDEEAMYLYRQIGQVCIGAAAVKGHFSALASRDTDQGQELDRALLAWESDELPNLRAAAQAYSDQVAPCDIGPAIDAILRDTARRRGEIG